MKKTLLAAIIAATALVPPAALAQDRGGRWGNRGGGAQTSDPQTRQSAGGSWRGQSRGDDGTGTRPQRQWGGGERGNWQRPSPPQTQQPQGEQPRRRWNGGDRGNWQRPAQPQTQPGENQQQRPWNGGNRGDWQRPERPQQWRGDRAPVTRSRDDTRSAEQFRRDRWNATRGRNERDWNDRNRGNWRNGDRDRSRWSSNRYDSRTRWNNNWRNDRRYDWRGYRSTNRNVYRLPRYYAPSGWGYGYRRFDIGFTLNSILYASRYWINDPFAYRLPEVDGPYRWVRYYNDALLVDIYTGEVVDTIYDIFW